MNSFIQDGILTSETLNIWSRESFLYKERRKKREN